MRVVFLWFGLVSWICVSSRPASGFPEPSGSWEPRSYLCGRSTGPLIVDGRLDEPDWQQAAWTEDFVDIEGERRPAPRLRTRAKLLWDEAHLYVGAELEEPDIPGTYTARDAVIYHEPDFEIFIDPDGDTHAYYELEINALNTVWDLLLLRPYRDGGPAVNAWDIAGLCTAVHIDGTLNQPGDEDRAWSVEIALPWAVLAECAGRETPPREGDCWRVNFSRVQYRTEIVAGRYRKLRDPGTGRDLPEDNWVWSPQGLVAMHYPEMWGFVRFTAASPAAAAAAAPWEIPEVERRKWALRQVYYGQMRHREAFGAHAVALAELGLTEAPLPGVPWPPSLQSTASLWEAILTGPAGETLRITQDGRVW